jgi:hypothetical protein
MNLRLRTPSGSVTLACANGTTFNQLKELIQQTLKIASSNSFQILFGYPPRELHLELSQEGESNGEQDLSTILRDNDTLIIKCLERVTPPIQEKKMEKKVKKTKLAVPPKEVKKGKSAVAPQQLPRSFGANIHTLNPSSTRKAAASRKAKSSVGSVGPTRKTKLNLQSEEDIGSQLINALNGSTGKSNQFLRHVFRRAVTHQYDQTKAEARVTSLQSQKYSLDGNMLSRTLGNDLPTKLNVKFHKGIGHRSYFFETVDLLSTFALKAVVRILLGSRNDSSEDNSASSSTSNTSTTGTVTSDPSTSSSSSSSSSSSPSTQNALLESRTRELATEANEMGNNRDFLRPQHLSRCSPRVFWSLVYHYGPNIPTALSQLLPTYDWTWMTSSSHDSSGEGRRQVTLSEKALENERQKQEELEEKQRKKLIAEMRKGKKGTGPQITATSSRGRKRKTEELNGEASGESKEEIAASAVSGTTTARDEYKPPVEDLSRKLLTDLIASPLAILALDISLNDKPEGLPTTTVSVPLEEMLNSVSFSSLLLSLADLPLLCHDSNCDDEDSFPIASPEMMSLVQRIAYEMTKLQTLCSVSTDTTMALPFVTFSHLLLWIHVSREVILNDFWRGFYDLYESLSLPTATSVPAIATRVMDSQTLSFYLLHCKVTHPKDLSLWRNSAKDFLEYLVHTSQSFSPARSSSSSSLSPAAVTDLSQALTENTLAALCHFAQSFRDQNFSWSEQWQCPEIRNPFTLPLQQQPRQQQRENEKGEARESVLFTQCDLSVMKYLSSLEKNLPFPGQDQEEDKKENEETDSWTTILSSSASLSTTGRLYVPLHELPSSSSPSSDLSVDSEELQNSALGTLVMVQLPSEEEGEGECEEEAVEIQSTGEVGMVIAYLPPTDEEPMALWKIHLQRGDFVDLEKEELLVAIKQTQTTKY